MNSPRRTLLKITWYICLLAALIGAVPTLSLAQAPLAAPSRLHRHHWKPAHRLYRARPVYTGINTPDQAVYPAPAPPVASATLMAPQIGTNSPIHKKYRGRLVNRRPVAVPIPATATALDTQPAPTTASPAPSTTATDSSNSAPVAVPAPPVSTVAAPVAKSAPKPAAILDMTRDAAPAPSASASKSLGEPGPLNIVNQLSMMLGALLATLLIVFGVLKGLQKLQNRNNGANPLLVNKAVKPFLPLTAIAAVQNQADPSTANIKRSKSNPLTTFELISSLSLPDSASSIHLVRAAEKMLVLSTTQSGSGVTMLTELGTEPQVKAPTAELQSQWINKQESASAEAISVFSEILREQASLSAASDRADLRALERVDSRLTATQEKLNARLKAGAELSSAVMAVAPPTPRRRTSKAAAVKASDTE